MARINSYAGDNQKNFKKVAANLRKQGVAFRINVMECCRGCVTHEKIGAKTNEQPYGFIYGGQGNRVTWNERDEMIYASSLKKRRSYFDNNKEKVDSLFVNHGNDSAEKIVEAFQSAGFETVWDGNDYSCVEVHI